MKTKATLILAAMLAAGSAATQAGAQQVNPRNPSDSRAFDVMETDQGPPTATDRLYAKPKHKKHGKKAHRAAETQQSDMSSSGASGTQGTTGNGYNQDMNQSNQLNQSNPSDQLNQPNQSQPPANDWRKQPENLATPDQPRVDK